MDQKSDANKAMVRRFVEDVKNKRHLEQMGEIFHADYHEHNATVSSFGPGIEGYQNFLNHLFTAFPEDEVTIDEIVAEGDMVSYRGTETGTHKAEFPPRAGVRHGPRSSFSGFGMVRSPSTGWTWICFPGSHS